VYGFRGSAVRARALMIGQGMLDKVGMKPRRKAIIHDTKGQQGLQGRPNLDRPTYLLEKRRKGKEQGPQACFNPGGETNS